MMEKDFAKMEKFLLTRIRPTEEKPRGRMRFVGITSSFMGITALLMAHNRVLQIETISIYYFYFLLALIPFIMVLTIKKIAKNMTRDYGEKSSKKPAYLSVLCTIAILVVISFIRFMDQNFSPETILMVDFVVFTIGGLMFICFGTVGFYVIYVMRKYASYFKDARLRRDRNGNG